MGSKLSRGNHSKYMADADYGFQANTPGTKYNFVQS